MDDIRPRLAGLATRECLTVKTAEQNTDGPVPTRLSHKSQHETGCGDGTTIDIRSAAMLAGTFSASVTS